MRISNKAKKALNTVVEKFKTGDLSPIVAVARIQRDPRDNKPMDKWSFRNQVLALIQTDSTDCRGYRQWREVGRQVQRGQQAAYILGPCTYTIEDEETGEEKTILRGFKSIPVFSLDQTEGEPLPEFDYAPLDLPPLADVAQKLGVNVEYVPLPPDRLGQYSQYTDNIKLGTHDVKTFFHELAHACHKRILGNLKPGQDEHQEIVAEFTGTVLMWLYGYGDRTGNCWRYVRMYAKNPLDAIIKALGDVEKILDLLENGPAV